MNHSDNNKRPGQPGERNSDEPKNENRAYRTTDLPDNAHDEERMQPEEVIIDMPDVSDIPGQETVHVPPLGELADTTISSDDEEGLGIFGDDETDEDTDRIMGNEADVTAGERAILARTDEDMPTDDENRLRASELDNADFDGDQLNEGSLATDVSGFDLDTNLADDDAQSDAMGQGDEENSNYSLGSDSNDNLTEGTP